MQRFEIIHRTYYNFATSVQLGPHTLRLRPREGPELRIESALLETTPAARVRWHRDAEDNAVATATFQQATRQLRIESQVIVQQSDAGPDDSMIADRAAQYPFAYSPEEVSVLSPYLAVASTSERARISEWAAQSCSSGERLQTWLLLQRLASNTRAALSYQRRDEAGVQTVSETLARGSGSCRDSAFLFMEAVRSLGLAARFVSGYSNALSSTADFGSTHAWTEVFVPGAGWMAFDPSLGGSVGSRGHIAVAVARSPESVPPIAGSFVGPPGASMDVGVWVRPVR